MLRVAPGHAGPGYDYLADSPPSSTATASATARGGVRAVRRSTRRADLRVKVALDKAEDLAVDSVVPILEWRELAGARGVRHVRHHLPRPSGPAPHPDVGDLRRGLSAAEGLPAARPVHPGGADAPGAHRQPRGPLLDGRAVASPRRIRSCPADMRERLRRANAGSADPNEHAHGRVRRSPRPVSTRRATRRASRWACRSGGRARAGRRAHADQHRPAAPGHARRAAAGARARRRDGRPRASRTSATCTPASRSSASTGTTTRSSRSPTASTTWRRWRTTSASRWRSRS